MIFDLKLDIYNWDVRVIQIDYTNKKELTKIRRYLKKTDPVGYDENIKEQLDSEFKDGGLHLYHKTKRETVLLYLPSTTLKEAINTTSHEIDHVVWTIVLRLRLEKEASAYINGYLSEQIFTKLFKIKQL